MAEVPVLSHWWDRVRTGLWFLPVVCVTVALVLAISLIVVDRSLDQDGTWWTYAGGPEGASAALTTIASSMITFTGLVFSIMIVALQLTSSQFSPRALRNFLRDRVSQFALGVFVATFTYAFAALTAIRYQVADDPGFVPAITVTMAYVLVGASVVLFVHLIHHTAQSLRAVTIIERIAGETRAAIEDLYPPDGEEPVVVLGENEPQTVPAPRGGVLTWVDLGLLARDAREHDVVVEVTRRIGDFVCEGEPILRLHGDRVDDPHDLLEHVHQAREPTMRGDAGFGFRQLVDIAERALSPGVNDPTTAVQCIDRIHDLLRTLTGRPVAAVRVATADEQVRVLLPSPSYGDLVRLATEEVRYWGRDSLQVGRRLEAMLADLVDVAEDPERRRVLLEQRALLHVAHDGRPAPRPVGVG